MTASAAIDAAATGTACTAYGPILWSRADTEETIRQAKAHNAAWRALCG